MRVEATIELPEDLLTDLDRRADVENDRSSRSSLIEAALRVYLATPTPSGDSGDLAIINAHASALNEEAADVLEYQLVP